MHNIIVQLFRCLLLSIIAASFPLQKAEAETVLYCQSGLATGFAIENGSYITSGFLPTRYTVKVVGDFSEVIINNNIFDCRPSYSASFQSHQITCFHTANLNKSGDRVDYGGLPKLFYYDKKTQRFLFVDGKTTGSAENGGDSDNLYAGKCESF